MSMTKQQMIGVVGGGVFVVVAGALGYMLFDAAMARGEAEEDLSNATSRFHQYYEAKVFPSQKSIADVKSNETSFAAWRTSALELAASGDRPPAAEEEPSVFKQRLQAEVRRMANLPGGVNGRIAAPDFLFGFEQYLGESGVLPQSADVPRLAVQLDAISHAVDIFAASGILEVKAVRRIEQKAEDDEDSAQAKKKKKGKAKKGADDNAPKMTKFDYSFECSARPAAVVQMVNRFAADPRFAVVREFAFKESADSILDRLSAKESAATQAASQAAAAAAGGGGTGRRRRRGAAAAQAVVPAQSFAEAESGKTAESAADRMVSDPELDAPLTVSFILSVHDFGTGGKVAAQDAPAAANEGERPAPAAASEKEAKQ